MPNKPDKFGIKFWLACDVNTKYIINGFPNLGKDERRENPIPLEKFVILKLMEPFTGCRRNVTTNNLFTSVSLATKLFAKKKKTVIVGTNKQTEIAEDRKESKRQNDSVFKQTLYFKSNFLYSIQMQTNKKSISAQFHA